MFLFFSAIICQSIPLSLIQEDKSLEKDALIDETIEPFLNSDELSELDDCSGQLVPSIKLEEIFSPYSPDQSSGSSSPNDKVSRAVLAAKLLNDLDTFKEGESLFFIFADCSVTN